MLSRLHYGFFFFFKIQKTLESELFFLFVDVNNWFLNVQQHAHTRFFFIPSLIKIKTNQDKKQQINIWLHSSSKCLTHRYTKYIPGIYLYTVYIVLMFWLFIFCAVCWNMFTFFSLPGKKIFLLFVNFIFFFWKLKKKWITERKPQCPHCRSVLHVSDLVNCRFFFICYCQ